MTLCLGRYLPFYRYKKHLGLDVNVKNARVRARAEVRRHNAIPVVCMYGYRDCSCYPHSRLDSFNSRGCRGFFKSKSIGDRG